MKKISFTLEHFVATTPEEVKANYIDYGHEVFVHSRGWSKWWRRFEPAVPTVISPTHHRVQVTLVVLGLFRMVFHQDVRLFKHGIESNGKNIFGFPIGSKWKLYAAQGGTRAVVDYFSGLPDWLGIFAPLVVLYWRRVREVVWAEDVRMMEYRAKLLREGFQDHKGAEL